MSKIITATFKTRPAAEQALVRLETLGLKEEQISMIVSDQTRGTSFNLDKGTKADEGIVAGGVAGGLVGAILAALLSAGAVAIPGAGIVISGWLISAAAGLGAGAAAGGLVGGLIGAGIPEYEAKLYEDAVKNGAILLAVKPANDEQAKMVKETLLQLDAYNLAA